MVDILGIGASGLAAYRKLLETVGGNITNATTDGYVRRDVQLSVAGDSLMMPTSAPSTSGSGVVVDSIRRASDTFLQTQSLKANALNMQSQTLADSLAQLEKTLFATNSNPGSVVQDFYSRFADVANSPTSAASRISVVDSGKQVANVFAQTAASIQDSIDSARAGIDAALTSVNSITSQLARLNVQIQSASSSGQKANDLLDQRDKLLNSLSNLANFNYTEQTTGAVTVYLGDTASGRPIVTADDSHPLGIIETGDKLEIAMDPFSQPSPTNQLTSGTVAGLMDFRAQAKSLLDDVNRLAVGFAIAVNDQHQQGVDLNGVQGGTLFSTDGLTATGAKTNLGDAKLMVSIDSAASLSNATYTVKFNAADKTWTVKSSTGGTVTGENNLSLGGVNFAFDGAAHDQDTFTVSPLFGAASSMRFLLKNPDEVAVALPLYVDPASTNAGNGELLPLKRTDADAAPTIPSATDIFNTSNTVTDFRFNGAAFYLPAGATSATLNSLGAFSAVHFDATGGEIAALTKPYVTGTTTTSSLNLAIKLDGALQPDLRINLSGSSINDVADAINAAASQSGLGDAYYASVMNGTLTINALGSHKVSDASLVGAGFTASGAPIQIQGVNESGAAAAEMQIFTREGRQLSGPPLTDQQAKALITSANGFLPDAQYVPPENTTGYPGVNVFTADPLLKPVTSGASTTIDVASQSAFDMPQAGYGDKTKAGAVYAMKIDGLAPVRVAGDQLAGAGPAEIASALADQLNAQAGRYAWLGSPINFTDSMTPTIAFNVSIDGGEPHTITFNRSQETRNLKLAVTGTSIGSQEIIIDKPSGSSNGVQWAYVNGRLEVSSKDGSNITIDNSKDDFAALGFTGSEPASAKITAASTSSLLRETGTFDLGGASDLQVSLVSGGRVMITTPQRLRTTIPTVSITPANILTAPLLAEKRPTLFVTGAQLGTVQLTIDKPIGTSKGVSWSVADGKLTLTSSDATMQVDVSTAQKTTLANTLGFSGAEQAGTAITGVQGSPIGLATLGFTNGAPAAATLTSAQDLGEALLAQRKPHLQVSTSNGDFELVINGPSGASHGVNWSYADGRLSLSSDDAAMHVVTASPYNALATALGFSSSQPGKRITAGANLAASMLAAAPVALTFAKNNGGVPTTYSLSINGASGPATPSASGVSWTLNNGKLTLTSDAPIVIKGETDTQRSAAQSLGFRGSDLDLKIESTIASANSLTQAILAGERPRLQVRGDQIGTQILTINGTNGSYNGITWSMTPDGKLRLTSADPTFQIDAGSPTTKALASALGFTGAEAQGNEVVATNNLVPSMLGADGGAPITVTTDDGGDSTFLINGLSGTDADSGVSWSYDSQIDRLVLSSTSTGFQVKVSTADAASAAQTLGFRGDGFDNAIAGARIRLTSTATDRAGALVDSSATVSRVGQSISFKDGIRENLIVALTGAPDGLKRISANVVADTKTADKPPPQDLEIRILDSMRLEIFDPATGVSLANRNWRQDSPITYQGMSFTIHGAAKGGDIFTIRNDGTRSSDNRNALRIADLALTSLVGKGQGSFQDVYAGVTAKLGSSVSASSNNATSAAQAASDLKSAYEAKTGVNLDREAADLIRFQQAYQAAAQVIMAARDMFSTILKSF